MTLADLSKAFQALRTALMGRSGFEEHGSAALRARFAQAYEAFRAWYAEANALEDAKGSFGEAEQYVESLRELTAAAAAEGIRPSYQLPRTPREGLSIGFGDFAGLFGAALGIGALVVLTRGRKR
jgi:hypothetical protein